MAAREKVLLVLCIAGAIAIFRYKILSIFSYLTIILDYNCRYETYDAPYTWYTGTCYTQVHEINYWCLPAFLNNNISNLKVEKETPIVHQNIKNIMSDAQTTLAKNLYVIMVIKSLAKRGLEPRTSRMRGECSTSWATWPAGIYTISAILRWSSALAFGT